MQNYVGQNVLITTSNWFIAPNGRDYRAVWGKLEAVHEAGKAMGFIPNRAHANWFMEIGGMIIMGCQVMYVIKCENKPSGDTVKEWISKEGAGEWYDKPMPIYISESKIK